jgi:hypothetical protein
MRNRIALFLASVSLLLGFTAAPAQATPFCGSGYICVYDDLGGTSLMAKKYWTDWTMSRCYTMGSLDRRISYVVNDSTHDIIVSKATNCGSGTGVWYANSHGPMNSDWNNAVRSWYRVD